MRLLSCGIQWLLSVPCPTLRVDLDLLPTAKVSAKVVVAVAAEGYRSLRNTESQFDLIEDVVGKDTHITALFTIPCIHLLPLLLSSHDFFVGKVTPSVSSRIDSVKTVYRFFGAMWIDIRYK